MHNEPHDKYWSPRAHDHDENVSEFKPVRTYIVHVRGRDAHQQFEATMNAEPDMRIVSIGRKYRMPDERVPYEQRPRPASQHQTCRHEHERHQEYEQEVSGNRW